MDSMDLEQQRGITIQVATYVDWKDTNINIIDTPDEHVVMMFVCAKSKSSCQQHTCTPVVRAKLQRTAAFTQLPIGLESEVKGVIDLVRWKAYHFEGNHGFKGVEGVTPEDMVNECTTRRQELIETVAYVHDTLAEIFLEEIPPTGKQLIRWRVFSVKVTEENYNTAWWELRTKYQGMEPAVERTENDFDPGRPEESWGQEANLHQQVCSISETLPDSKRRRRSSRLRKGERYFMSYVLQFQFHKAACEAAGHTGPLHTCSIYESKEAGKKIGDMLKIGKSKPWPEALKKLTRSETLDVGALSEYFEPLRKWMVEQRKELGYTEPGWDVDVEAGVSAVLPTLFNTVMGSLIVTVVLFC
ncbi:elongation factor G, mitochondrial [Pocillopora verrucosa]|uniref:elongation factor G, mitochondrial n=1 Tax=Pocillopora verrucosa TaxID=203993 RepID=UPI00333F663D